MVPVRAIILGILLTNSIALPTAQAADLGGCTPQERSNQTLS